MGRTEVLEAVDFGQGDDDALRRRILAADPDAVFTFGLQPHWRTREPQRVWWVRFHTARLRNTVAHGHGCAAGFECCIREDDQTDDELERCSICEQGLSACYCDDIAPSERGS